MSHLRVRQRATALPPIVTLSVGFADSCLACGLGHGAALTTIQVVIHYRTTALLPKGEAGDS